MLLYVQKIVSDLTVFTPYKNKQNSGTLGFCKSVPPVKQFIYAGKNESNTFKRSKLLYYPKSFKLKRGVIYEANNTIVLRLNGNSENVAHA